MNLNINLKKYYNIKNNITIYNHQSKIDEFRLYKTLLLNIKVVSYTQYNTKTKTLIDCSNNIFSGYVLKTNAYVWGTCASNMLSAWNDKTGAWVYGDCNNSYNELYKKHKLKK